MQDSAPILEVEDVTKAFDVDHMHAFDAQSQLAIGASGDSVASAH